MCTQNTRTHTDVGTHARTHANVTNAHINIEHKDRQAEDPKQADRHNDTRTQIHTRIEEDPTQSSPHVTTLVQEHHDRTSFRMPRSVSKRASKQANRKVD